MWYLIIGALAGVFAGGLIYISFRAAKLEPVRHITCGRKGLARLLSLAAFLAIAALLCAVWNLMNALVCIVHLVLFWLICDLASFIINKARRRRPGHYRAGYFALILCALYLAGGWFALHHVWTTPYALNTEKPVGSLRIVQITDAHMGTTLDADDLRAYVAQINALSPDVVAVTGDFVDDDTSRTDMLGGCAALGELQARYGVFFAYGNHDKGYSSEAAKGWNNAEFHDALLSNGVVPLEDAAQLIDDRFYIVGRQDRSEGQRGRSRESAERLLSGLDHQKYIIVRDHQPHDFDAEAEAGADLVLCGHTHGGQFIPINHVGEWIGENCLRYGHERRIGTDFIVSSGISNWAFQFKTGCHSEYTVIDIRGTDAFQP